MKTKKKPFICICCSFLLAVFVTALGMLITVKLGFATNNSINNAINQVNYAGMVYDDLMLKCEAIAIPNALSKEVFDGVFSREMLESDCKQYLNAQLNGETVEINTDSSRERLVLNINEYVMNNNLKVDGAQDEIIGEFADKIIKYYTEIIQVPYAGQIGNIFRMISTYFKLICPPMFLFSVAIIYALFKLNRYKKNRAFRYMAYSFMTGAFSVLTIPVVCYNSGFYKRLQIYPEYVYSFIVRYIENGLRIMAVAGVILMIVAGVMIATSCIIKHRLKQGYRVQHHRNKT